MNRFKMSLFVAVFLCLLQAACAGSVTAKNGQLNATGNLYIGFDSLFVDSILGRVGIGTITPQCKLEVNGDAIFRGNMNLSGNKITGLAAPVGPTDAVNRQYVDALGGSGTAGSTQNCFVMVTPATYVMSGDIDAASRSNCIVITPSASGATLDCNNRVIWSNPAGSGTGIRIVRGTHDIKISNCNFIDTQYAYYIEDAYNVEINGGYEYTANSHGAAIVNSNNVTFKGTIMDTLESTITPTNSNVTLDGMVITTRGVGSFSLNPTSYSNLMVKNSNITTFGGGYPLYATTSNVSFENSNIVGGTAGTHTLYVSTDSNLTLKNSNITTTGVYGIYSSGNNRISLQGVNLRHTADSQYPIAFDSTGRLTMQDISISAPSAVIGIYTAGATTVTGTNVNITFNSAQYMIQSGGAAWSLNNLRLTGAITLNVMVANAPISINGLTATATNGGVNLCHPAYYALTLTGTTSLTGITKNCG